jgi:hypothetical protein
MVGSFRWERLFQGAMVASHFIASCEAENQPSGSSKKFAIMPGEGSIFFLCRRKLEASYSFEEDDLIHLLLPLSEGWHRHGAF